MCIASQNSSDQSLHLRLLYCVSRSSNDIKRAAFTVEEVVDLTINFYRRNYIEGLFLSSGIFKNADTTMERLVRVQKS
jgi:predicted DNA-binding helix-hairpin-helix protein